MTKTINLSNTQFSYQLVFFVHIYGYVWLAEGCLWHFLSRQNLQWHLLPGGMYTLLQLNKFISCGR